MKLEEFIAQAKVLKSEADNAEYEFMLFLFEGEKNEKMWRTAAHASFVHLLRNTEICDPRRYSMWKEGSQLIGNDNDLMKEIGVTATQTLTKLRMKDSKKTASAVKKLVQNVIDFKEAHGKLPSSQWCNIMAPKIRGEHETVVVKTRIDQRRDRIVELEAENNFLKKENGKLKKQVLDLQAKLDKSRAA